MYAAASDSAHSVYTPDGLCLYWTLSYRISEYEIFGFIFFYESVSPEPLSIPLGPFRFFTKIRGDIGKFMFITGVKDTRDPLFTSVNYTVNSPLSTTPAIKLSLFSTTPAIHLSPLSLTPVINLHCKI